MAISRKTKCKGNSNGKVTQYRETVTTKDGTFEHECTANQVNGDVHGEARLIPTIRMVGSWFIHFWASKDKSGSRSATIGASVGLPIKRKSDGSPDTFNNMKFSVGETDKVCDYAGMVLAGIDPDCVSPDSDKQYVAINTILDPDAVVKEGLQLARGLTLEKARQRSKNLLPQVKHITDLISAIEQADTLVDEWNGYREQLLAEGKLNSPEDKYRSSEGARVWDAAHPKQAVAS